MANKIKSKIILVFVEGTTDADCLDPIIDYYKKQLHLTEVDIRVHDGDMFTSDDNIRKDGHTILKEQVESYLTTSSKLAPNDILHAAFITDTDGIFINPMNYIINPSVENFTYDLENRQIVCQSDNRKKSLNKSRQTKASKLAKVIKSLETSVLTINRIAIPYSVYFNSLNLEHILFDEILPDSQKTSSLDELLDSIDDDPEQLIKIFNEKAINIDYLGSWEDIKSLEMNQGYTNLNLLFELISNSKSEKGAEQKLASE